MAINIDFRVKNGLVVATTATVDGTTQSLSTNTGALQVIGGAAVGKNLYVGGYINVSGISTFTNTTVSASTTTGALIVAGGAGVGGNLYVGGDVNVAGVINASIVGIITTATNIGNGFPGQILYQQTIGKTNFIAAGTTGNVLVSYGENSPVFQNTLTLAGNTNATSTNSGAFQVVGGAGIGNNLWVGGTVYGNASLTGLITTSTNISSGTNGQLVYQITSGMTGFVGPGVAGQLLMSSGTDVPLYVDTSSIYIGYSQNAVTSTNITGGSLGSILYQNGTGTTTTLPLNTAGYFLLAGNAGPFWQDPKFISINTATSLARGTTGQIPYQTGPGVTSFIGPGTLGQVLVSAGASATGPVFQNTLTLAGNTISTSPTTGAFQVTGGVGIGGNLYVGGDLGTNLATFNLINNSATTINFAGSGTSVNIGAATGVTTVKNNLTIVGNLTVQGTSTIVDSTVTNITDPILTLGGLANDQPLTTSDNKDKGIAFKYYTSVTKTGFFGYKDSTGFFTFIPDATITTEVVSGTKGALDANIAGGSSQSLVYQSGPNVTAFLAAGTAGNILQTNGTGAAPSWVNALTLAGTTNATSTNSGAFQVVGGAGIGGNLYVGGITTITNTATSISTTTGALTVAGGAGIKGDMYVGGTIYGTVFGSITTASNITKGDSGQLLYQSAPGVTSFVGTGTLGNVLVSNGVNAPTYNNTLTLTGTTAATSTMTGALQVRGGVGIGGYLVANQMMVTNSYNPNFFTIYGSQVATPGGSNFVLMGGGTGGTGQTYLNSPSQVNLDINGSDIVQITSGLVKVAISTVATSTITGALTVVGGVGIGGNLYVGGTVYGTINGTITTATNIAAGTTGQIPYQTSPGLTSFIGPGTSGNVLVSNGAGAPTYNNTLTLTGTTAATSTITGALQVVGGVGIGGNLYVGGTVYGTINGTITTATNIAAGTTGQLLYQSAQGVTAFAGPGSAGQILVSAGAISSGPVFTNTSSISVGFADRSNSASTSTSILGGTVGQILYQGASSVTAFAGPGTAGQLLVSAGTTSTGPVFTNTSSIYVGYSVTATTLAGGTLQSIHYQSSTGTTAFLAASSTSGWLLSSAGTGAAPTWVNPTTSVSPSSLTVQSNVSAFEYVVGVAAAGSAQNAYIATNTNSQFGFNASTGFMALGTTTPISKLHINETGGAASQIRIEGHANSGISMYTPSQGSGGFIGFDGSGNFGINQKNSSLGIYFSNSAGTNRLYITANGGISFNGTTNYGSQYQILQSNGDSAPTWVSVGQLGSVTSSTQINTVGTSTNAVYYPTFVNSNNSTSTAMNVYTTSSFTINPSTGFHGIGLSSNPNTGMSNLFGVAGSIVAGALDSTNGTVLLQGKYSTGGATAVLGTEYSSGSPVLGSYVYPSTSTVGAFLSSYAVGAITRGAYTIAGNSHNWYIGASQIVAIGSSATMTNPMVLNANGLQAISLGIGTTPSGTTGEIRASNEITAYYTSDARLKENIKPIENPITMIDQIRGVYFDWTDNHIASRGGEDGYFVRKHDIGVIAQEVEAILPEIVATRDNGFKAVKYEKIIPLLIEAIKSQQRQIDQIQATLAKLVNK